MLKIFAMTAFKIPEYTPSKKTKELIIYIAYKLKDKPNYGSILLNKTLYFIDCVSYVKNGKPITDFTYIKQKLGPTPDPAKFLQVRNELENKNELKRVDDIYFGKPQRKYIANREPSIELFDKNEIVIIEEVIATIANHSGADISNYTHNIIGYNAAKHMEEMPFYSYLID